MLTAVVKPWCIRQTYCRAENCYYHGAYLLDCTNTSNMYKSTVKAPVFIYPDNRDPWAFHSRNASGTEKLVAMHMNVYRSFQP